MTLTTCRTRRQTRPRPCPSGWGSQLYTQRPWQATNTQAVSACSHHDALWVHAHIMTLCVCGCVGAVAMS
jgi:hypothetical protein